jgi:hypothetical protein
MYFHTSLSVLIFFISFSSLSLPCFFFSLYLSVYLFFTYRNLLLSILFLLHSLNAFTASFFSCSHSLSHHPFFLLAPFDPLTVTSFFVVAFSVTSFSSAVIFSTSCSSNVAFFRLLLYSSTPCSSHNFTVTFFSSSLVPPFRLSSWLVPSIIISRERWSDSTLSPIENFFTLCVVYNCFSLLPTYVLSLSSSPCLSPFNTSHPFSCN